MRIRELAKELNIQNKEILEILEKQGITGKTPASNISDEEEGTIRSSYKAAEKQSNTKKDEAAAAGTDNKEAEPASAAPKSKIMAVFRPQNAKNAMGLYPKNSEKKILNKNQNTAPENEEKKSETSQKIEENSVLATSSGNMNSQNTAGKKTVRAEEKYKNKKENKKKHPGGSKREADYKKTITSNLGEMLNKLGGENLKSIIAADKSEKEAVAKRAAAKSIQNNDGQAKKTIITENISENKKALNKGMLNAAEAKTDNSKQDISLKETNLNIDNIDNEKEAAKVSVEKKQLESVKKSEKNNFEKNNLEKNRQEKITSQNHNQPKNQVRQRSDSISAANDLKPALKDAKPLDNRNRNQQARDGKGREMSQEMRDNQANKRNRENREQRDNKNRNQQFQKNTDNRSSRGDNRTEGRTNSRTSLRTENKSFSRNPLKDNRGEVKSETKSEFRNDSRSRSFGERKPGGQGYFRDNSQGLRNKRNDFADKDKDKDERSSDSRSRQSRQRSQGADKKTAMDGVLAKKPSSNRTNKNNFKNNNKLDKKHRTEDGPSKGKISKHPFIMPVKAKAEVVEEDIKEIIIPELLTIKDLAAKLRLQPSTIVKKLFLKGKLVTINSEISFEQAEEIALEYDVICTLEEKVDVIEELLKEDEEDEKLQVSRPPVVCVMGHVDHGKTSLLDAIRKTNVSSQEAGGITQHIGAYMVSINGQPITFLDTPGHEAFTAMRMRGALSTDIAILVVAADDGVMPQTVEAISHAKAAGVEIIVAVNKIDKESANIDRVKQELSEYELIPEDWGGSTIFCPVSAHTKEGIENLLEMIILTAEVKELKANPNRKARGLVIEAELDKGKGPVATVLVQKGTLHVGDFIAAGACSGKVRAMINDKGHRVKVALPSTPVEILGLDNVPNAGEVFVATENDKEAKAFAATFISESKNKLIEETKAKLSLDALFSQIKAGNVKELPIIVKADVQGSVEAVKQSLTKLSNEEVAVKVIHGGVGAVNESDVALAAASNAIIIGFNVRPDSTAKASAEHENVDLRLYKVIYKAIEDVEAAMKGMLEPVYEERVIGHAEIRQLFKASGVGTIAGAYVLDGKFQRGCKARISREGEVVFDGTLASLKRFKDDVKEVAAGYECGLVFEKFNDIKELDQVEAYIMAEVSRA